MALVISGHPAQPTAKIPRHDDWWCCCVIAQAVLRTYADCGAQFLQIFLQHAVKGVYHNETYLAL
jgi:hypothetical protein